MLFGFFIAGLLHVFFKSDKIGLYLGNGKVRPVFLSALMGIPIPLCSCGVIPAAAGLKEQGANNGATLSFLISTPESGVDSIAVTYSLIDPLMTIMRPISAFVTAVIAGIAENFLIGTGKNTSTFFATSTPSSASKPFPINNTPKKCCAVHTQTHSSITARIKTGLQFAFIDLLGDIGKYFVIGVLLAGIINFLVPDNFIDAYMDNKYLSMLIMLIVAAPMYVCATASTPIVAAFILKGLNPGAALVFLLAGPATNMASLSMISGLLGKKSLGIYLSSIAVCSLAMGFLTDTLYDYFGISIEATIGKASEIFPPFAETLSGIILAVLLIYVLLIKKIVTVHE